MKFIVARCPNCGAHVEVDKDSDSARCEYCGSKVMIAETLENYKFNNLSKVEKFIIIGDRFYRDNNYKDAYNNYAKALELNPKHEYAMLKKGFCKSLSSDYSNLDIKSAIEAVKKVEKTMKNENLEERYNNAVKECQDVIDEANDKMFRYYEDVGLFEKDVPYFNSKLEECLSAYEYLYSTVENEELKEELLYSIIKEIDNILMSKPYLNGRVMQSGVPSKSFYHLSSEDISRYRKTRYAYVQELDRLKTPAMNRNTGSQVFHVNSLLDEFYNMTNGEKIGLLASIVFCIIGVLASVGEEKSWLYVPCILTAASLFPPIKRELIKRFEVQKKSIGILINIARVVLIVLTGILVFGAVFEDVSMEVFW